MKRGPKRGLVGQAKVRFRVPQTFQCAPPARATASSELKAMARRFRAFIPSPLSSAFGPRRGILESLSGDTRSGDKTGDRAT
jgi:hypothetical protein